MKNKLLGIDYGDKRVGLALAEENSIALPYKVLANKGYDSLLVELQQIIDEENISRVIIGLPHSLSGQTNDRLQITEKFIDRLQKDLIIDIVRVDEQLTSKLFEKMGVSKDIDKHAAQAILDTYLKQQNGGE